MCRSPNSSANHGLADGTRSVPATFVGHVFYRSGAVHFRLPRVLEVTRSVSEGGRSTDVSISGSSD